MTNPVFIMGCSRTGSKIYMSILNRYSSINITPELHFLDNPWKNFFYKKDFVNMVKHDIGNLNEDSKIPKLIDLMYSNKLDGSFWSIIKKRSLNKKTLENRIKNTDRNFKNIFEILIEEHAKANNKKIPGAKFPVSLDNIDILLKWFPNCKILFLIRDPRAIYASLLGGFSKKLNSKYKASSIKIIMFLVAIIQFKTAVKKYKKYSKYKKCQLIKFEDIITQPEKIIKKICKYLEIEFNPEMLSPSVFDSYQTNQKKGFDKETLNRWKKNISPLSGNLIKIITQKEMREMEYLI